MLPTVQWWRWAELPVVWWSCVELPKVKGNFYLYGNRYETVYFMMRQNLLQDWRMCLELPVVWWWRYVVVSVMWWMMVYDATSHMMMEVGEEPVVQWRYVELLKAFWFIVSVNLIISVVIEMRQYISRRKILHKMKEVCGAISHKMDKFFNLYIHTSIYFAILSWLHF